MSEGDITMKDLASGIVLKELQRMECYKEIADFREEITWERLAKDIVNKLDDFNLLRREDDELHKEEKPSIISRIAKAHRIVSAYQDDVDRMDKIMFDEDLYRMVFREVLRYLLVWNKDKTCPHDD